MPVADAVTCSEEAVEGVLCGVLCGLFGGDAAPEPAAAAEEREGDWVCARCGTHVFAKRTRCFGCKARAPRKPAAAAADALKQNDSPSVGKTFDAVERRSLYVYVRPRETWRTPTAHQVGVPCSRRSARPSATRTLRCSRPSPSPTVCWAMPPPPPTPASRASRSSSRACCLAPAP